MQIQFVESGVDPFGHEPTQVFESIYVPLLQLAQLLEPDVEHVAQLASQA